MKLHLPKLSRMRGFTLIEVGIALIVLGVVTVAILQIEKVNDNRARRVITEQKMQRVVQALADYVSVASRLPCPADPSANDITFGHEWGVRAVDLLPTAPRPIGRTPSVNPTHTCDTTNFVGIVPFQALNLNYDQILDGWGRAFTYAVSPAFAQDNDLSDDNYDMDGDGDLTEPQDRPGTAAGPDSEQTSVHAACRSPTWIIESDNSNSPKALFCCAGDGQGAINFDNTSDLVIQTLAGDVITQPTRDDPTSPTTLYGDINTIFMSNVNLPIHWSDSTALTPRTIEAPAFALVSHGPNGLGAYLANNSMGQYRPAILYPPDEAENANGDRTFRTGEPNSTFDDIIYWDTQNGIMAQSGISSCVGP